MTANQWRVFDDLSARYGNNTLRVTTRQTIQFHGVAQIQSARGGQRHQRIAALDARRVRRREPQRARAAHARLHQGARTGLCGLPAESRWRSAPQTPAYHSIWIDGVQLDLDDAANKDFVDPLYGKTYLPRKVQGRLRHPAGQRHRHFHQRRRLHRHRRKRPALRLQSRRRRRHGPQPRQRGDLSAPRGRASDFSRRRKWWTSRKPC